MESKEIEEEGGKSEAQEEEPEHFRAARDALARMLGHGPRHRECFYDAATAENTFRRAHW